MGSEILGVDEIMLAESKYSEEDNVPRLSLRTANMSLLSKKISLKNQQRRSTQRGRGKPGHPSVMGAWGKVLQGGRKWSTALKD